MHESSGSLSSSPRSMAHSSTAKALPRASPIFLVHFPEPATEYDRSSLTSFNPVGMGLTSPNHVGESGIYLLPTGGLRAPFSDSCPAPKALIWADSCPAPKSLPWVDSCSSPNALSWVGSCPARNMLSWVGSLSPLSQFTILAYRSHV